MFRSYRRCDEISDGEAERECLSELARERGDDRDECRIPSDRSALIGMWLPRVRVRAYTTTSECRSVEGRNCAGRRSNASTETTEHRLPPERHRAGVLLRRRETMPNAYQTVLYDAVTVGRTIGR